jgi:hypothetical protein
MGTEGLNSSVVFHLKVYKNSWSYLSVLGVICAMCSAYLFVSSWPFRDTSSLVFFLMYTGIVIFSWIGFYRKYRMTKLILHTGGIEYHAANFQLTSSWDDLSLAKNRSILAPFSPLRLTMKKPMVRRISWFDWDLDVLFGNARFFIPMSPRLWERYNELVKLINVHRPDLLLGQDP